jgi:thioredoxin 1
MNDLKGMRIAILVEAGFEQVEMTRPQKALDMVDLAGRVRVAKLNVDESPATAARFAVRGIPTLLALKRGP